MIENKTFKKKGYKDKSAQLKNKEWWQKNPMNYNWNEEKKNISSISLKDIKDIDNNFFEIARDFAHPNYPNEKYFNAIIDYKFIKNKKVLEIGCGLGSHASLLSENCKTYTGIDITDYSIEYSKKRFEIMKIKNGNFILADAENLPFENESFDYVWSWGVIHHSFNIEKIILEIHRVLKKKGKSTIMIYNKNSIRYYWYGIYQGIFKLKFLKYKSLYDINMSYTDGYLAGHYTAKDIFSLFNLFSLEKQIVCDSGIPSIGFGWHRFSLIFPKLTKKINTFLNNKFGWFRIVNVNKIN